MNNYTLKKGDLVTVLAGKDKGKKGTVEKTLAADQKAVVSGINLVKRHFKPSQARPKGGISEIPAAMHRAKLQIVCPHCSKPTRVSHILGDSGAKYRACIHCKGSLDSK